MLALAIYGTALGIILGILTLIPLVGLIILLIVNGKATNLLREDGIHVGLLGARNARSRRLDLITSLALFSAGRLSEFGIVATYSGGGSIAFVHDHAIAKGHRLPRFHLEVARVLCRSLVEIADARTDWRPAGRRHGHASGWDGGLRGSSSTATPYSLPFTLPDSSHQSAALPQACFSAAMPWP